MRSFVLDETTKHEHVNAPNASKTHAPKSHNTKMNLVTLDANIPIFVFLREYKTTPIVPEFADSIEETTIALRRE